MNEVLGELKGRRTGGGEVLKKSIVEEVTLGLGPEQ